MTFLAKVFRSKDSSAAKKQAKQNTPEQEAPAKPQWTDAWLRTEVIPEEVQELLRGCTQELKGRALDVPFLLLPFRPSSDPSAARTFIRNYFNPPPGRQPLRGDALMQELRLTEPMVLCSVMKWCWSRLPGGVVTWEAYELFKVGEQDSQLARDAFSTFIPLSVESDARTKIIFDFFDLLAAIAAHGKSNGLGGRKLSRYAGWWAFEHVDTGNGFEASYKNWTNAADATSHLFFAYLRSISPDSNRAINGISTLPIALQSLVQATEYPPETPTLLQVSTTKVVMIVDTVSPTPFALLRRAKNFEYRDSDHQLKEFANYEDPIRALTDECLRVLKCISSTNQSSVSSSKASTSLRDASWSRFEDIGFGGALDESDDDVDGLTAPKNNDTLGLSSTPQSPDLGRPTTPSWADFLSTGFADDGSIRGPTPLLLPPDKVLPPIATARGQSSQSHKRTLDTESTLEPGELASITTLDLDDSFWWVWISSLSGEEPATRKAVFGRCALIETVIAGAKWLILEEQVKGAAPEPEPGAYIVEKKRFFGFSRKGKLTRRKSSAKKVTPVEESYKRPNNQAPHSKTSIGPDQHARIQAAAAALQKKHREQQEQEASNGRKTQVSDDEHSTKTDSMMTLQPAILSEASQAMKWASNYDKDAVRSAYLSDSRAGTGAPAESLNLPTNGQARSPSPTPSTTTKQAPPAAQEEESKAAPPSQPETPKKPSETVTEVAADVAPSPKPTAEQAAETAPAGQAASELEPMKSVDSSDSKKLKKKPVNTGFKGLFGSGKKKNEQPPMKPTGAQPSAVAAARAALEGKAKAAQEQRPVSKAPAAHRLSGIRRPSAQESTATPQSPRSVVSQQPPESEHPAYRTSAEPPRAGRDAEYEDLSRVNTDEKAAADREFSSFDQGPLTDQPAFAPGDSPVSNTFQEKHRTETPTNGRETPAESSPLSSTQDRWAQIRKQAAERAAQYDENRVSLVAPTDDGDTSGEETIESRVARIKARVAELTGNMEAGR
ncbi:hypothetical protein VTN00DRAFT_7072 [Thermoascus crustaceus]|uniref:uncharacterized protein n=1 Tax=Thermoascus crustaceus TaxID=5088 RepID=UPI0037420499